MASLSQKTDLRGVLSPMASGTGQGSHGEMYAETEEEVETNDYYRKISKTDQVQA